MNEKERINYAANAIKRELKRLGDLETITPADVAALNEIGCMAGLILFKIVKPKLPTNDENN